MFYWFARSIISLFYHIRFKIIMEGKENFPSKKGGYILASNHVSNFDPPLVGIMFKGYYTFMAKEELFKNRFFGWILRKLGAYPVKRGSKDPSVLDKAIESLHKGKTFIIFPEGTRSKTGELGRAKSGVSIIAVRAKAPVIPVFVKYGRKKFRQNAYIAFGKPIPKEEFEAVDANDKHAIHSISNRIMSEIAKLKESAPDIE